MNQQYGNQYYNNNQQQFRQGGFQQGVTQQQLERIHQNSLFNGQESSYGTNPQIQRIHQQSMQNGTMANPSVSQQQQGYGGQTFTTQGYNQGVNQAALNQVLSAQGLTNQGFSSQGYANQGVLNQVLSAQGLTNQGFTNQGYNQGFQQGVSQQQIDRIHQASLNNGGQQPDNQYVERIHQATMQNGTMAQPQLNNYGTAGFGTMMGAGTSFGGQTFTNNYQQPLQQGVSQQQIERIHQASLFNGRQQQPENAYVERIHQATMQSGTMAQPQLNNYQTGTSFGTQGFVGGQSFGGQTMGLGVNNAAFNQVMSADAGIRDAEGRTDLYAQSLYTGRNQYDTVNANVLNQMTSQMNGRQF
jgi:hypothetical protein